MARIGFHGAARTVTGSRYLLESGKHRCLIDAGLFQGHRQLRELNWREPPFPIPGIDQVLLTHAHIDHCGALPRLVRGGYRGPVHCTRATAELLHLMLLDSARIQEDDAEYANRKGYSKHKPALPLYRVEDAEQTLKLLEPVEYQDWIELGDGLGARFSGAGHILGSSSIEVRIPAGDGYGTVLFSGDIGRYGMPLHVDPSPRPDCEVLICESTYGNRDHESRESVEEQLLLPLESCLDRGGTVLVPAFAVGRSQQITLILRDLMKSGRLGEVPLHLDSPMAIDATRIYGHNLNEHHIDPEVFADGRSTLFPNNVHLHRTVEQSIALNDLTGPRIIISASGMLTGGRVLHHLKRLAPDPNALILLAGFQAAGTRGRDLLEGAPTVRVHGRDVRVRCEVAAVHGLSAHADRGELMRWITTASTVPRQIFLTHGEPESAYAFALGLRRRLDVEVAVPELDTVVDIQPALGA